MGAILKLVWIIEDMELPDHVGSVRVDAGGREFVISMGRGHVIGLGGHASEVLEEWLVSEGNVLVLPESSKYGRMGAERVSLH